MRKLLENTEINWLNYTVQYLLKITNLHNHNVEMFIDHLEVQMVNLK